MEIDVIHFRAGDLPEPDAARAIVVIDVLRATTVIAAALANGAREILAVAQIEDALQLAARSAEPVLLGGEAHNAKIPGFDAGNSPLEYGPERVAGRRIVLRTTNGTRALDAVAGAPLVFCAAFANLGAVARALLARAPGAVTLVCAGQDGTFSLEDFLCAGALVERLEGGPSDPQDGAIAARQAYVASRERLRAVVESGSHARALIGMGLQDDVTFALHTDRYDVVPALEDGRLVAASPA